MMDPQTTEDSSKDLACLESKEKPHIRRLRCGACLNFSSHRCKLGYSTNSDTTACSQGVLKPSKLRKSKEKHAENTKEEHAINTIETPNYNPESIHNRTQKTQKDKFTYCFKHAIFQWGNA